MSADNWAECHVCIKKRTQYLKEKEEYLEKRYGKVPAKEWMELHEEIEEEKKAEPELTLREDYEIGMMEGILDIRYSASCQECGFRYKYEKQQAPNA